MSIIESVISSTLLANTAVAAVVGTRIYPVRATQGAQYPLVIFHKINSLPVPIMRGASGLVGSTFQIDSWAKTALGAADLATKCRSGLDGLRGSILGIRVDGVLFLDEFSDYDDDANLFRVSQDYRFWHNF